MSELETDWEVIEDLTKSKKDINNSNKPAVENKDREKQEEGSATQRAELDPIIVRVSGDEVVLNLHVLPDTPLSGMFTVQLPAQHIQTRPVGNPVGEEDGDDSITDKVCRDMLFISMELFVTFVDAGWSGSNLPAVSAA